MGTFFRKNKKSNREFEGGPSERNRGFSDSAISSSEQFVNDHKEKESAVSGREKVEKEAESFKDSPWVFLIRKSKLTYLIIIFLLVFGLLTIRDLPRELNPEVQVPVAIVYSIYPGASPLNVEEQVTKKIETQVAEVEGVDRITSTSSLGSSSVVVEFEADQNVDDSIRKLQDEVDQIIDIPDDATDPKVQEINLSDEPIFVATLQGENYDVSDLKSFGENLETKLKGIPFVSEVKVIGGRDRVIEVDINEDLLAEKNLSMQGVIGALSSSHVNMPLGSIEVGNSKYAVRVKGKFEKVDDIAKTQVGSNQGLPIYLEDVVEVKEGFGEETSKSRLSVDGGEPIQAVSIQLFKKTGGDITAVADEARKVVEEGKGDDYPEDVQAVVTRDLSTYISENINTLSQNGLGTVVIILLLLFIFLGWREALIAGLSVPFSFFIAFIAMALLGESLNFLSLFSLVLALGLLVDSAIVIVEGMYQKVASFGVSGYQSAIATIKEYAAPLLSGMLTTVAAFAPLLFIEGIMGEFMKTIPIVVISTLVAALFVSLTIVPAIGATLMKPRKLEGEGQNPSKVSIFRRLCRTIGKRCKSKPRSQRMASRAFTAMANKYYDFLPSLIDSKKWRRILLTGVWILFFVALALPITGILKVESFGATDAEYFYVNVSMPNGIVLEETDKQVRKIEQALLEEPEVVNFVTSIGSTFGFGMPGGGSGGGSSENSAYIEVNLTKNNERDIHGSEIVSRVREKIKKQATIADVSILEEQAGPPTGDPISLRVEGDDIVELERIAEDLKEMLVEKPTVIDAETSANDSPGEFVFIPNKSFLSAKGISVAQLSGEIRNGIAGNNDLEITKEGKEIKVVIDYQENIKNSISAIESIEIASPRGDGFAISELGEIKVAPSLASIQRQDQERTISVTAGTDGGNPTEIMQEFESELQNYQLPSGYNIVFGGEQQELQETFSDMFMKMIIGIILILFILVIQFNSYKQVLLILFTIPLAMIGVFIGMAIFGLALDIPAFIGVVSLVGIVVNNAIILIDQTNRELAGGKKLTEAVRHAGYTRLRPVILTSITTIFGLLPLSISEPTFRNMGLAIIFGLAFSAFLTLFVLPTAFVSFYRKKLA